ncbi:MAG TPA: hypothetical protein VKG80_12010 [Trebonia sp.]|nr:hypothetical protein [Trebonia sp.]
MSSVTTPDRYTTLPDERVLASTLTALEEHGFSVEVVDDLDAARAAVLARIPRGSSVMTNTSVTLAETGSSRCRPRTWCSPRSRPARGGSGWARRSPC